jgi:thiol-disulfide isomerase/thioredoxin
MSVVRYLETSAIAASILVYVLPAFAFETKPFDASAFEVAQAAGKPVLVEVTAPWPPTCKAQKPILEKLGTEQNSLQSSLSRSTLTPRKTFFGNSTCAR